MDKAKILRDCNRIEEIVTDAQNQHRGLNYYDVKEVVEKAREIGAEVSAQPKTNGDRIRAMSDEELADVLEGRCACCVYHPVQCKAECNEGVVKWLKQEASEDA